MGEWLQKTIWRVQAVFGSDDAKSHLEALDAVNKRATPIDLDIYNRVEMQPEIKHTGFVGFLDSVGDSTRGVVGGIAKAVKDIFNLAEFTAKHLIIIVVIAGLVVGGWYFYRFKKMGKI
jgi:hypothetical protein